MIFFTRSHVKKYNDNNFFNGVVWLSWIVRRGSVGWCGVAQLDGAAWLSLWCGVAQLDGEAWLSLMVRRGSVGWCGMAQLGGAARLSCYGAAWLS
jgi:hypothetical protein